jgi:hypothetical protein
MGTALQIYQQQRELTLTNPRVVLSCKLRTLLSLGMSF